MLLAAAPLAALALGYLESRKSLNTSAQTKINQINKNQDNVKASPRDALKALHAKA